MANHRKPTRIKILEGTRKDRIPKDEPKSPPGIGAAPSWLGEEAAAAWDHLAATAPDGLLTRADSIAVELFAQTYATWMECQRATRRDGLLLTTITERGEVNKAHPLLPTITALQKQMVDILNRCGMTPSGRASIGAEDGEKKPDALLEYMRAFHDRRRGRVDSEPIAKPNKSGHPTGAPKRTKRVGDPTNVGG